MAFYSCAAPNLLPVILSEHIVINLKGKTKETVIKELLDILSTQGKLVDRTIVLNDLLDREKTMSTAIPNGIALPHAKTNAVQELTVAIGIKKSGVDFDSALDENPVVGEQPSKYLQSTSPSFAPSGGGLFKGRQTPG
jgi:PTS system nitrogen regulatory IIA component